MSFAQPNLLYALLLPPLLLCLLWYGQRRVYRRLSRMGGQESGCWQGWVAWRQRLQALLLYVGLSALVFSLAQPRWGTGQEQRIPRGIALALLIDCSYSMYASDLYPDRITHTHFKIQDLLQRLPQAQFAILPFAGVAALRSPLSSDQAALQRILRECTPELFERRYQGTAIGKAVLRGLDSLEDAPAGGRAILLFSDGDDPDQDAVDRAALRAEAAGIPIYSLLMADPDAQVSLRIADRDVPMPAQHQTLDSLSQRSGGRRLVVTTDNSDLDTLAGLLTQHLRSSQQAEEFYELAAERYQWPLALAILCLLLLAALSQAPAQARAVLLGMLLLLPLSLGAEEAARALHLRSILAQAETDADAARAALQELLLQHPDYLPGHYNAGLLLRRAEPLAALRHLDLASGSPQPALAAAAFYHRALLLAQFGRLSEALQSLEEARSRQPEEPLYRQLQDFLQDQKQAAPQQPASSSLRISPRVLEEGRQGSRYEVELQVQGGSAGPSTWQALQLPRGLRLSPEGRLQGVPEESGPQMIVLSVSDGTESRRLHIPWYVLPALQLRPRSLAPAILGQQYQQPLRVQGARQADWQLTGLPAGLRLQAAAQSDQALILGQPTEGGTFTLDLRITDSDGSELHRQMQLVVQEGFAAAQLELPPATRDHPYRHRLSVRGPDEAYTWQPLAQDGLQLDERGLIQGSPRIAGLLHFPVSLSNRQGEESQSLLQIAVHEPPSLQLPPQLDIVVGQWIIYDYRSSQGTPPLTWSIAKGALPPGLYLDLESGRLQGAAQESGEYVLTIRIQDRWQAQAQAETRIVVHARMADEDALQLQAGEQADDREESESEQEQSAQDQAAEGDQEQDTDQEAGSEGADSEPEAGDEPGESSPEAADLQADESPEPGQEPGDPSLADAPSDSPEQEAEATDSTDLHRSDAQRWLEAVLAEEAESQRQALRRMLQREEVSQTHAEQPW